jgi:peptidoglycan/xylan/chitin deacetylase (PgdA/CDA1 family)
MVLTEEFDRHMRYLADNDYRPMTVSKLVSTLRSKKALPPRTVAVTFDDGLRDFLTAAMPILRRHNFPATLYVVSGCVGQTSHWLKTLGEGGRPMLTWQELRELSSAGIEIGAHTASHPQLDVLPSTKAFAEIHGSKCMLEDHLGQSVESFAYPHGYSSRSTRRLVRDAGFTSACRVRHALSSTTEDPYALSRIIMTSSIGTGEFQMLLRNSTLPIAPPTDRLASTGWRMVRRFGHLVQALG